MKNLLIFLFASLLLVSCSGRKELYSITDEFVASLSDKYERYAVLGVADETKTTSDNKYQVMPTGRLIIVKFLDYVDGEEYEELRDDLKNHYSGDSRVNDVYINQGGTVVIDCRR